MLVATYDYWGYYNVCFLGGEVQNPARNIPRALLLSILLVAILYITMNIACSVFCPGRSWPRRPAPASVCMWFRY